MRRAAGRLSEVTGAVQSFDVHELDAGSGEGGGVLLGRSKNAIDT